MPVALVLFCSLLITFAVAGDPILIIVFPQWLKRQTPHLARQDYDWLT